MKNREFINKGLYFEGLRRIKLPALIVAIVLSIEAILVPVAIGISDYIARSNAERYNYPYDGTANSYSGSELHLLLFILIFAAPIFAAGMFSFLNKRNASDFYHSLPHKRSTFCISSIAALVTWLFAISVFTSGLSRLFAAFFPNAISVQPGTYFEYMFGCFVTAMLVSACVTLAMTITGNVLSNVIVTLMLLFFPRYVIMFVVLAVTSKLSFVPMAYINPLLSVNVNIPAGMVFGFFNYMPEELPLISLGSQIYTLVLSLVYFAIATVLYCRRKSESAEHSAPSRFVQAVYRIVAAMIVSVPVCFVFFANGISDGYDLLALVILYIIVIVIYFLYEIITTRKWKNLVKALPGLAIVAVLNLALYGAMFGLAAIEKSFSPEPEDIDYIQVMSRDNYSSSYYDFNEYALRETSNIKIYDEDAIAIVAEALEKTIEDEDDMFAYDYYYDDVAPIGSTSYVEYHSITVKINAGLTTKYRTVYITTEEEDIIKDALSETEKYAKIWLSLPQAQRGTVYVDGDMFTVDGEAGEEIYDVMKREVAGLDFTEWYDFVNNLENAYGYVNFTSNGMHIVIPFSNEILPKTTEKFYEALNEGDFLEPEILLELLEKGLDKTEIYHVEMKGNSEKGNEYHYSDGVKINTEDGFALLKESIDTETEFKYGDTFITVHIQYNMKEDGTFGKDGNYYTVTVKIKDEYVEALVEALDIRDYND